MQKEIKTRLRFCKDIFFIFGNQVFNHVLSWNVVPYTFLHQLLTVFGCDLVARKRNNIVSFLVFIWGQKSVQLLASQFYQHMLGNLWIEYLLIILTSVQFIMCPVYVLHIIYQCVADSVVLWCLSGTKCLPVWPLVSNWSFHLALNKLLTHISWVSYRSLRLNGWVWDLEG